MSVVMEEAAGGRRRSVAPMLVGPATILVVLVLVVPMAILFRYSLNQFIPGQFMVEAVTVENYVKFFTDSYYLNVLWTTVQVAVACTVISLTLAFPVAYVLARTTSRYKSLLVILAVFPLMVGNVVRAAGWMVVLGNDGVVNSILRGIGLTAEPIKLLYTPTAVVIGIIAVVLPYMILTLQSVLEGSTTRSRRRRSTSAPARRRPSSASSSRSPCRACWPARCWSSSCA